MNFSSSEREKSNYFARNTKRQLLKKIYCCSPHVGAVIQKDVRVTKSLEIIFIVLICET